MSQHIPRVIFRDAFILWVMMRSPHTLGNAYRTLRAKSRSISVQEYISRIDFLANRGLVELDFSLSVRLPTVNATDDVPDAYPAILIVVMRAHKFPHTP